MTESYVERLERRLFVANLRDGRESDAAEEICTWAYRPGQPQPPLNWREAAEAVLRHFTADDWTLSERIAETSLVDLAALLPTSQKADAKHELGVGESPARRIRPRGPTVDIIRELQAGRHVNEIAANIDTSADNVRKVKSRLLNGEYEL